MKLKQQKTLFNYLHMAGLPKDEEGPVFAEPWHAQVFALAVSLCEQGHFSWPEWVEQFSQQIKLAQRSGDADWGDTYYHHWLNTLEALLSHKQILTPTDLTLRKEAWRLAYLQTPHGKPIELSS